MSMSRRAGVTLTQPEAADEAIALFVIGKLQPHAFGIILAAGKAAVLLQADVAGVVAVGGRFLRHRIKALNHEGHEGTQRKPMVFPLCNFVSFVVYRLCSFPNRFLPQQVLARITHACDKLPGHRQLLVFWNEIMRMRTPRPLEVS